jgi:hypothetical protein
MNTHRKLILLSCITTLTASFVIAGVAEAGPVGPGMNKAPTELEPINQDQTKARPNKTARNNATRLVVGPGTAPAAGVIAPAPDHSVALTPKGRRPIAADLTPGQLMSMSVGGGTEIAEGIGAGISVTGLFRTGSLFGNSIDVRSHPAGSSPENTLQVALIAEGKTQSYEFEIDVGGGGMYDVAVDAYWVNDPSLVPMRDHDELLAIGKQRPRDGKLRVTLNPDPSWTTAPTAYYVIVSRDDADWTFRGARIARGL